MKIILFVFLILAAICKAYALPLVADGWWGEMDYLLVWRKERFYPPLITTGILGAVDTEILFGDHYYKRGPESGGFFDAGVWMTECLAFGGSLMLVGSEKISYDAKNPPLTLFRPFLDPVTGLESAIPLDGTMESVHFEAKNNFWILDGYLRWSLIACPCWDFSFLAGFGYADLNDTFEISEVVVPDLIGVDHILGLDRFDCINHYYAGVFGFVSDWSSASWRIHFWGKVYFGNMIRDLNISGFRRFILPSNRTIETVGDLLSQPSNIGNHSKRSFEVVPITAINLQVKLCPCISAQVGYFYAFLPRILLAGRQVDLEVDLDHVLTEIALPRALNEDTSFWMHGLSVGLFFKY